MDSVIELRAALLNLLVGWSEGRLNEEEVRNEAERVEALLVERSESWFDKKYVGNEADKPELELRVSEDDEGVVPSSVATILGHLSNLHLVLATKDDIPAMLTVLNASLSTSSEALATWEAYSAGVDWSEREARLKDEPFYLVTRPRGKT